MTVGVADRPTNRQAARPRSDWPTTEVVTLLHAEHARFTPPAEQLAQEAPMGRPPAPPGSAGRWRAALCPPPFGVLAYHPSNRG